MLESNNLLRRTFMIKHLEFDPASYLDSEEVIAHYLNLALASGDNDLLLSAISDVAKAIGMVQIARDTVLGPIVEVANDRFVPL